MGRSIKDASRALAAELRADKVPRRHARSLSQGGVCGERADRLAALGFAAWAVSAYVRAVLCPSLSPKPRGGVEEGGETPRRADELLSEMDAVLQAREELDALEKLAQSPLVSARAQAMAPLLAAMPGLLQGGTLAALGDELLNGLFADRSGMRCVLLHGE
ncbi:hypothetical protein H632_c1817p0 [Helicosporidium sp. ATCC 50920]|nr:hypothetical protein H632_c1817p0 [Helicosporidium sp. ATCC 50920]|eukprot:KDD73814.1 hypothetical protein H632_c1817p0 [Helicosporidium sp. ATCC 50920]